MVIKLILKTPEITEFGYIFGYNGDLIAQIGSHFGPALKSSDYEQPVGGRIGGVEIVSVADDFIFSRNLYGLYGLYLYGRHLPTYDVDILSSILAKQSSCRDRYASHCARPAVENISIHFLYSC